MNPNIKLQKRTVFENQSLDFILPQLISNMVEGVSSLNCVIVSKEHPGCVMKIIECDLSNSIRQMSLMTDYFGKQNTFYEFDKDENSNILAAPTIYTPVLFRKVKNDETGLEYTETVSLTELQLMLSGLLTDENGGELNNQNWGMNLKIWDVYELELIE